MSNDSNTGFAIPPQPKNVLEINSLLDKGSSGSAQIASLVSKDASLTAQVLKTVSSPAFLGRSVDSVPYALNAMGLRNFKAIVLKAALQQVFSASKDPFLESFWRHSELVAESCASVAKHCRQDTAQSAYMAGLFHDCAMPLMAMRFKDYPAFFKQGFGQEGDAFREEERRYSISHCALGYLFARAWNLPQPVCLAIRHHHDAKLPSLPEFPAAESLVAIVAVGHYLADYFDPAGKATRPAPPEDWAKAHGESVGALGLVPDDLHDLGEALFMAAA